MALFDIEPDARRRCARHREAAIDERRLSAARSGCSAPTGDGGRSRRASERRKPLGHPGLDAELGRAVDARPNAGEPAAAAEERIEVRDLGAHVTFAISAASGSSLDTVIRSMPCRARPGDQEPALDPPRHLAEARAGLVLRPVKAKQRHVATDEDDGRARQARRRPGSAPREIRREIRPVGAREALEVLGLPHPCGSLDRHLDLGLLDRAHGASRRRIGPVLAGSGRSVTRAGVTTRVLRSSDPVDRALQARSRRCGRRRPPRTTRAAWTSNARVLAPARRARRWDRCSGSAPRRSPRRGSGPRAQAELGVADDVAAGDRASAGRRSSPVRAYVISGGIAPGACRASLCRLRPVPSRSGQPKFAARRSRPAGRGRSPPR